MRGNITMRSFNRWVAAGALAIAGSFAELVPADALEVSGYLDTSYTYNLDSPPSGLNTLRGFDTEANNFNLNMVELVMQQPVEKGAAGYKVVLNYGADARLIASTGTSGTDDVELQQAFVTLPLGGGELMVGKFATLHGAEVIESPSNLNTSRSALFFYAIPFTHTGVRYHYAFNDMVNGHIGVNNGWDVVKDTNSDKSVELQVSLVPLPMLSVSLAGMMGGEDVTATGGAPSDNRTLLDLVVTIKPMDPLTVVLNYDNGSQDKFDGTNDATWSGIAGYLNYMLSDQWAATLRVESFDDKDGFRTGTAQTITEETVTASYIPVKNALIRMELRHDSSDEDVYVDKDGAAQDSQDTIGVEFVYGF